jgi:hypothetical protein
MPMVVIIREGGAELEYTGPSKIISNSESRKIFDVEALLIELRGIKSELQELKGVQSDGVEYSRSTVRGLFRQNTRTMT